MLIVTDVGRQCKKWKVYFCWNVFSWLPCLSARSNNELRELLLQIENFHFKFVRHFKFEFGSIIFLQIAAAKDPDTSFFKKLDGFQPCELTELKAGTHTFAVYGNTYFSAQSCLL